MKFIVDNWYLVAIALLSGSMLLWPLLAGAASPGISTAQVVHLINREKANVVDVCEPHEFALGHIVGSRNVPVGDLESKLASTIKNKTLPLVLVCQSGARSARAVMIAKKLGYEQAQSLSGGLGAWKTANLPLEKA